MKNKQKCYLPPYIVDPIISLQAAQQKIGWNITAFNLPNAWKKTKGEGVKVAILDSTPGWSPLLCKDEKNNIKTLTIEHLFERNNNLVIKTTRGEEIKKSEGLYVWNGHNKHGKHWQYIKHIIRHHYDGEMLRIYARGGIVDVTPNHSIISANGQVVDAKKIQLDDKICIASLKKYNHKQGLFFKGSINLAWLLGFWAAEGSIYSTKSDKYTWTLSNNKIQLLKKSQNIILSQFGVHSRIDGPDKNGTYKLYCVNEALWNWTKCNLICNNEKKVPDCILNSPKEYQVNFLKGYNLGDGYHKNIKQNWEFQNWNTKSQILAMGLIVMINSVTEQKYTIQGRKDKPNIIQISLNKPHSNKNTKSHREVNRIHNFFYNGYVYDIETECHTFGCGVGPIRIHNTGCDLDHPDLKRNLLEGKNFVNPSQPPKDMCGHGTHVAGTIAAENNEIGMVGVAPKCKIIPIKVLDANGNGKMEDVAKAIHWAATSGADIISLSLGSPCKLQQVRKAIQYAAKKGIPTFCAAGNAGKTKEVFYPAAYPETIAVGSIDENFQRSSFSNTGKNLDFMAPGGKIFSTYPPNWYSILSGTSMACPFVVGVAALLLSFTRKNNVSVSLNTVEDYRKIFRQNTIPISDKKYAGNKFFQGFGIIDPRKFVEWCKNNS